MVCAPRWAKRTSGIPVESNMQSLQIVPHTVWGFVGPVAVLLARWGFPVLCSVLPVFLWLVVLTGTVSISAPGRCRAAM